MTSSIIFTGYIVIIVLILLLLNNFKSSNTSSGATNANSNTGWSASVEKGKKIAGKFFGGIQSLLGGIWSIFRFLLKMGLMLAVIGGIVYGIYMMLTSDAVTAVTDGSSWDYSKSSDSKIAGGVIVDGNYAPYPYDGTFLFETESNSTYRVKVSGCNVNVTFDDAKTPYSLRVCSSGKFPAHGKVWFLDKPTKWIRHPKSPISAAILVVNCPSSSRTIFAGDQLISLVNEEVGCTVSLSLNRAYKRWHTQEFTKGNFRVVVTKK